MEDGSRSPGDERGRHRFLELVGLTALAITQPVLDLFGRTPSEFIFLEARRSEIIAFALIVATGPPAALWLAGLAARAIGERARRAVHLAQMAALATLVGMTWLDRAGLGTDAARLPLALAAGLGFAAAFRRFAPVRQWSRILAATSPLLVAWFMLAAPVSDLVLATDAAVTELPGEGNGAPVVVLVLDELPLASLLDTGGAIDAELFPNLARLAREGTWYRNATTVAGGTWYAVPSLLTGDLPEEGTQPISPDHPENLFTFLAGAGYEVTAIESLSALCPSSVCSASRETGIPEGSTLGDLLTDAAEAYRSIVEPGAARPDPVSSFEEPTVAPPDPEADFDAGFLERNQPARYAAFVESLADLGPGQARYLHLLVPHEPWQRLPSGRSYPIPDEDHGRFIYNWGPHEWPVQVAHQRHLLQAQYADSLVGGVLDELDETGAAGETVLAVVSDHGIAFQAGEPVRGTLPGASLDRILPEMAWVPLLVRGPGVEAGKVDDSNAEIIDLLPTLAELVDLELPFAVDGRSLLSGEPRPAKQFQAVEISVFGNFLADPLHPDPQVGLQGLAEVGVASLLGPERDELGAFRIGEHPELVGTAVTDIRPGPPADARFELGHRDRFDQVRLDSGELPALIDGWIEGIEGEAPLSVALALNGRIFAVGSSFPWDGQAHAVVGVAPEQLFRPGANRVDAYLVEQNGSDLLLRGLAGS